MKKPRSMPSKLEALAKKFIAQYPVLQQQPHSELTSDDLDAFGIANSVPCYVKLPSPASVNDLNTARQQLVGRLNKAGSHLSWWAKADGFEVAVVELSTPTIWAVKPLPVAAVHRAAAMAKRNLTTTVNRVLKNDKMFEGFDTKSLPKEEKPVMPVLRDVLVRMGQFQANMAQAEQQVIDQVLKKLTKANPKSRLIPK